MWRMRACVYIAVEVERRRDLLRGPAGTWVVWEREEESLVLISRPDCL